MIALDWVDSSRVCKPAIVVVSPLYELNTTSLFVYCALAEGDSCVHELIAQATNAVQFLKLFCRSGADHEISRTDFYLSIVRCQISCWVMRWRVVESSVLCAVEFVMGWQGQICCILTAVWTGTIIAPGIIDQNHSLRHEIAKHG